MAGKIFVGITDGDWYDFLRERRATEVNFWKPSGRPFKVLDEGTCSSSSSRPHAAGASLAAASS